jgi:hypothetical protein
MKSKVRSSATKKEEGGGSVIEVRMAARFKSGNGARFLNDRVMEVELMSAIVHGRKGKVNNIVEGLEGRRRLHKEDCILAGLQRCNHNVC